MAHNEGNRQGAASEGWRRRWALRKNKEDDDVKWHRFFAWASVACMVACIYTGKTHA